MKKRNENPIADVISEEIPDISEIYGTNEKYDYRWVRKDKLSNEGIDPFRKWTVCKSDEITTNLVENISSEGLVQNLDVVLCKRLKEVGERIKKVQDTRKKKQEDMLKGKSLVKDSITDSGLSFYVKETIIE